MSKPLNKPSPARRSLQRLVMPLAFKLKDNGEWRLALQRESNAVRGMFVAEEEYRRLKRIEKAARRDYRENIHLADGPICTLRGLWSVFGKAKAKRHNEVAERRAQGKDANV